MPTNGRTSPRHINDDWRSSRSRASDQDRARSSNKRFDLLAVVVRWMSSDMGASDQLLDGLVPDIRHLYNSEGLPPYPLGRYIGHGDIE
jgi:hypothetical protein